MGILVSFQGGAMNPTRKMGFVPRVEEEAVGEVRGSGVAGGTPPEGSGEDGEGKGRRETSNRVARRCKWINRGKSLDDRV